MATTSASKTSTKPGTQQDPPSGGVLTEATKPFYAYVGAGDLAVEKVRALPTRYTGVSSKLQTQVKELRGSLQAQVGDLPAAAKDLRGTLQTQAKKVESQVRELPDTVKTLPHQASAQANKVSEQASTQVKEIRGQVQTLPSTLTKSVGDLQDKALATYGDLAVRGEKLVAAIRKQGATKQAQKAAKQTLAQAKGVRTQATNAAKQTVSQAKGVGTSVAKTADATATAVTEAVDKIG